MRIGASSFVISICLFIALWIPCNSQVPNCNTNYSHPLLGCLNCSSAYPFPVLNISTDKIGCTNVANCTSMNATNYCIQCTNQSALNLTDGRCYPLPGCKTIQNQSCIECYQNNYILSNGICTAVFIDYCWIKNASQCLQCSDQNLNTTNNCSVDYLCPNFSYETWQCLSCNSTLPYLHSSGIYCYKIISYCLIYQLLNCIACLPGYFLSSSTCSLAIFSSINLDVQVYSTASSLQFYTNNSISKCLDNNLVFSVSSQNCTSPSTNISYCAQSANGVCTLCLPSFYLNSSYSCIPCNIDSCLICDQFNCKECRPQYYLVIEQNLSNITSFFSLNFNTTSNTAKCMPCSIYSCLYCTTLFTPDNINQVKCYQCLPGFQLYNYTCFQCNSGSYFSIQKKACLTCTITYCQFCVSDPNSCDRCFQGYYLNVVNATSQSCQLISTFLSSGGVLTSSNVQEILNKQFIFSNISIYNDQKLLITSCSGDSNGYACLCNSNGTTIYTSLCYPIATSLLTQTISPSLLNLTNSTMTKVQFFPNINLIQMLSQLPQYNFLFAYTSYDLISLDQFAIYLQITTNIIRNSQTSASSQLISLSNFVFQNLYKSLNPYAPTIIAGPGYYFKFTPSTYETDNSTFISTTKTSPVVAELDYIYFNSSDTSSLKLLTGTAYVFLNQSSSQLISLKMKKISFLGNNQQYAVYENNNLVSLSTSSDSQGFITITNITTSTSSQTKAYFISSTYSSVADVYASQRIQNIFYRDSFIYILVFLALYLIFIPLCALVDCVDNQQIQRKPSKEQIGSYQGIVHRSSDAEEEIILRINYKDFFPIYNIANTKRPRRLLKLCLFLVNSQHGITFLTLIYFHLAPNQQIIAVLLSIPAYLCTIIMGYICGLLTLYIPGHFKYLINLFTLGYWILWVAIMSSFTSYQYKPFVYVFAIIFFVIDLLIDFLQTLLVYFTIKQEERQIRLFKALSRWLSYRGYYQFDKMAKQINQVRQSA